MLARDGRRAVRRAVSDAALKLFDLWRLHAINAGGEHVCQSCHTDTIVFGDL